MKTFCNVVNKIMHCVWRSTAQEFLYAQEHFQCSTFEQLLKKAITVYEMILSWNRENKRCYAVELHCRCQLMKVF